MLQILLTATVRPVLRDHILYFIWHICTLFPLGHVRLYFLEQFEYWFLNYLCFSSVIQRYFAIDIFGEMTRSFFLWFVLFHFDVLRTYIKNVNLIAFYCYSTIILLFYYLINIRHFILLAYFMLTITILSN